MIESGVNLLKKVVFFDIISGTAELPFIVAFALMTGILGLIYLGPRFLMNVVNPFKLIFSRDVNVTEGNQISSKKALLSAMGGVVGLGNIAGVAYAIQVGGPGVIFWIVMISFASIPIRFSEVFLAHKYREMDGVNVVKYGPITYIKTAFDVFGARCGTFMMYFFAVCFLIACAVGSGMFQTNQIVSIVHHHLPQGNLMKALISFVLATLCGLVLFGGTKRIVNVASQITSVMSVLYLASCTLVLAYHFRNIDNALGEIITSAFSLKAGIGGVISVIAIAAIRSIFSSGTGTGDITYLQSMSNSKSSFKEGTYAMAVPFLDNVVFCCINGIMIVASKAHLSDEHGVRMVEYAFASLWEPFMFVLTPIVFFFGFSTMLSWYFYAESTIKCIFKKFQCVSYFRIFCLTLYFAGGIMTLNSAVTLGDIATFLCLVPNVLAIIILRKVIKKAVVENT